MSAFDNSALKTSHPDPGNYAPSFWHDFHNKDQAGGRIAGVSVLPSESSGPEIDNTVKTTWDTHPFTPFNQNLTYDKTEGVKMTE